MFSDELAPTMQACILRMIIGAVFIVAGIATRVAIRKELSGTSGTQSA
jgi:hypothetical protein